MEGWVPAYWLGLRCQWSTATEAAVSPDCSCTSGHWSQEIRSHNAHSTPIALATIAYGICHMASHPTPVNVPRLFLLLLSFIGRKLRGAANVPSQLLHGNSYPRTGTFSVVSWTLAVKCLADGVRLEDCSTRLVRKRQNCGLHSLSSYVEQWDGRIQQSAGDADRRVMTLARNMSTGMAEPCHADIPARPSWR